MKNFGHLSFVIAGICWLQLFLGSGLEYNFFSFLLKSKPELKIAIADLRMISAFHDFGSQFITEEHLLVCSFAERSEAFK